MRPRPFPLPRPRGFTLIELLVVIAIIGVLIGLILPAVMRVRGKGDEVKARNDISQLDSAVTAFKSKMGVNMLPAFGGGTATLFSATGGFRLCSDYPSPTCDNWPEVQFLKMVWPVLDRADNGLRDPVSGAMISSASPNTLDANQVMMFFLTGGKYTRFTGFSTSKTKPFDVSTVTTSTTRVGPFFEVPMDRMEKDNSGNHTGRLLDPWGNPYAYFGAVNDGYNSAWGFTHNSVTVRPFSLGSGSPTKWANQKGVQIVSSGANGQFGTGGAWTPGSGTDYSTNGKGADDMANFHPRQLGVPAN